MKKPRNYAQNGRVIPYPPPPQKERGGVTNYPLFDRRKSGFIAPKKGLNNGQN
jgi:hypothetical protein